MNFLSTFPDETKIFIAIIVVLFTYFNINFSRRTATYAPTILTTAGIFCTFLGISIGLSNFDSGNIQASVPTLLNGLKTAFWASVFGVGGALLLKFRSLVFPDTRKSAADLADEQTAARVITGLENIESALVGANGGSLLSQMKLSRREANERLDSLKIAQREALATLSDMASKALIAALQDVIRDFNEKLTDQFGENFKQLNLAVGGLLEWQRQYRDFLESTTRQLREVGELMGRSTADYNTLVSQSAAFSTAAENLSSIVEGLIAEKKQMADVAHGLALLLREASGTMPQIERRLIEMSDQLASAVNQNQKIVTEALSSSTESLSKSVEDVATDLKKTSIEFGKNVLTLADTAKEKTKRTRQRTFKPFRQFSPY